MSWPNAVSPRTRWAYLCCSLQIAAGLFGIGAFAAIYHPVGLSMVVQGRQKTGVPLAVNGVFGNLGVACAALITGFLIDYSGWTSAFVAPGIFSVAIGLAYIGFNGHGRADLSEYDLHPARGVRRTIEGFGE
ncbi:MAG: MFS transporter [Alphaproteobacteria bacterium]